MTQKELSYIEDTLGHLQTLADLLTFAKANLEDSNLKSYVTKLSTKTKQNCSEIYKLLG